MKDQFVQNSLRRINIDQISKRISRFFQAPIEIMNTFGNVTKATYLQKYFFYIRRKFYLFLSFDIAITIRLAWMSTYIKRWTKRKRLWPSLETLASELNTSFIIAKPSAEEKNNKLTKELRYSFSHIERKIISMQSNEQRVVYFISKTIFYGSLKPLDPEKVQSFLLKNTMLWFCLLYTSPSPRDS